MAFSPETYALLKGQGGGGGGGSLIVHYNGSTQLMDKTVQEIYDAMTSGTPVFLEYIYGTIGVDYTANYSLSPISCIYTYGTLDVIRVVVNHPIRNGGSIGDYSFVFKPATWVFSASSLNSYPQHYKFVSPTTVG